MGRQDVPSHHELKYWSNGVRICEFYLESQQAKARKRRLALEAAGIRTRMAWVNSTESIENQFREIKKQKRLSERDAEAGR